MRIASLKTESVWVASLKKSTLGFLFGGLLGMEVMLAWNGEEMRNEKGGVYQNILPYI
jgi:hypothetical protein